MAIDSNILEAPFEQVEIFEEDSEDEVLDKLLTGFEVNSMHLVWVSVDDEFKSIFIDIENIPKIYNRKLSKIILMFDHLNFGKSYLATSPESGEKVNMISLERLLFLSKFLESTTPIDKKRKSYKTYLIKDLRNNLIKIGKSINPQAREKTLQSEMPKMQLIHVIDSNVESDLHKVYQAKRVRGEWFSLLENDIMEIINKYQK